MTIEERFWEAKSLDDLSDEEWEALCDGCGRCCLHKLEDEDSGAVHYTDIACQLLDTATCRCSDYSSRFTRVPDCLSVRPLTEQKIAWLPSTCAYVKRYNGEPLADWHPLISGNAESVRTAGIGMQGRCQRESEVPVIEWPHHLISWAE